MQSTVQRSWHGHAMGTAVHLITTGTSTAQDAAIWQSVARIRELETRWSRFLPDSELSQAANSPATWVRVSRDTIRLIDIGIAAWQRTRGLCDITGGTAISRAGYDRNFARIRHQYVGHVPDPQPFPGLRAIDIDYDRSAIRLAPGTVIDPGAIGKGLAADIVVDELYYSAKRMVGLQGMLINIGGDLRAVGFSGCGKDGVAEPWGVDVPTVETRSAFRWSFTAGAVATSSSQLRVWETSTGRAHHILHPMTGAPATNPPSLVSVHAGDGWWAEAAATALMLMPPTHRAGWADAAGIAAVVVDGNGTVTKLGAVTGRLS